MANSGLNVYYQNIRGLKIKSLIFWQNLLFADLDVITLTETWLHYVIYDGELCDGLYDVFRVGRDFVLSGKKSGGW